MVMASLEDALPVVQQQRSSEPQQLSGSEQLSFATQLREKEEELEEAHETIARDERIIQYWEGAYSTVHFISFHFTAILCIQLMKKLNDGNGPRHFRLFLVPPSRESFHESRR
jgi:hypothetical protein